MNVLTQVMHAELLGYLQALLWAGIAVVCGAAVAFLGISAVDRFFAGWRDDR